jgi:hypothetical protein
MRIGLGLITRRRRAAQVAFEAETTALLVRMSVAPDSTRRGQINTLIASLKTAGVWAKLDALYVMAAHDAQAARQNWKQNAFNLTGVNSPTFTTDRGYRGDGSTSYLDSAFNPTTAGGLFVQDNAHLGLWALTSDTSSIFDIGNTNARMTLRTSGGAMVTRLNDATNTSGTVPDSAGYSLLSRSLSASYSRYKNGSAITDAVVASTGMTNAAMTVCGVASAAQFSARQQAVAHWGASLTAAEASALQTALQTYLTAVGAA